MCAQEELKRLGASLGVKISKRGDFKLRRLALPACRCLCPQEDSNPCSQLRKLMFYPLNYEGKGTGGQVSFELWAQKIINYLRRLPIPPGRRAADRPKLMVRPYLLMVGRVLASSSSANLVKVNFLLINLSIFLISFHWLGVAKEIALPALPALAVRPMRWT